MKTYTLRCEYLGQTGEVTGLTLEDLQSPTVFTDVESEMSKCSGDQLVDAVGGFHNGNPLHWFNFETEERGILMGIRTVGDSKETFDWCNELLRGGGKQELHMLNEDDEIVTDESEADWNRTFAQDSTVNEDSLNLLDCADWALEEEESDEDEDEDEDESEDEDDEDEDE